MENYLYPEAAMLVIFGAGGDLTRRKLVPALYDLFLDRYLPERFAIIGVDLQPLDDESFRQRMRAGVSQFARRGAAEDSAWHSFAPHQLFPPSAVGDWQPNRLAINIQPVEGILIRFQAKQPGLRLRLGPEDLLFTYKQAFEAPSPDAYETLLLDVIRGDATQFMRSDQVEVAWSVVMPILEAWAASPPDFPNYPAGTWGPEAAEMLLARDARRWLLPSFPITPPGESQIPHK